MPGRQNKLKRKKIQAKEDAAMKKCISLLLTLFLFLSSYTLSAEEGNVTIQYGDQSYVLSLGEVTQMEEGRLRVQILSPKSALHAEKGRLIYPIGAYISANGEKYYPDSRNCITKHSYIFDFACPQLPDSIYVYPEGNENAALLLYHNPFSAPIAGIYGDITPKQPSPAASAASKAKDEKEESSPAPETPVPVTASPEPLVSKEETAKNILQYIGDSSYEGLYQKLLEGATLGKNTKGADAKSFQSLLAALGADIPIDGNIGRKTIAALKQTKKEFGMEEKEHLAKEEFEQLIFALAALKDFQAVQEKKLGSDDFNAILTNPAHKEAAFPSLVILRKCGISADEFSYLQGCTLSLAGRSYYASRVFAGTAYKDSQARSEAAVQAWPENGEIYHNKSYKSTKTQLVIAINDVSPGHATLAKIYAENGDLVSCLFIHGTSSAKTKIPPGTYRVKLGVGEKWYGLKDSFGYEGHYQNLLFPNKSDTATLAGGKIYTITVNTSQKVPEREIIKMQRESFGGF